jgi:hypothetical protein
MATSRIRPAPGRAAPDALLVTCRDSTGEQHAWTVAGTHQVIGGRYLRRKKISTPLGALQRMYPKLDTSWLTDVGDQGLPL